MKKLPDELHCGRLTETLLAILVWLSVALCTPLCSANDVFSRRVQESGSLKSFEEQLSPDGKAVLQSLYSQYADRDTLLPLAEFRKGLLAADRSITKRDYDLLCFLFRGVQRPRISGPDVSEVYRNLRDAIRRLQVSYTTSKSEGQRAVASTKWEFALDGPQLFFERSAGAGSKLRIDRESYDGKVLREYVSQGKTARGTIQTLDSRVRFFDDSNPLVGCLLVNSVELRSEGFRINDLARVAKDQVTYEATEDIHGVPCVVLGSIEMTYYLAPDYGYAAFGVDYFRFEFDQQLGKLRESAEFQIQRNKDVADYGNGLWLPNNVEIVQYTGGRPTGGRTTKIDKWIVNKDLPPSLFSDSISDGAVVSDATRNAFFRQGGPMAVSSTIDAEMSASSSWSIWFIVANVLALIVILVFIVRRRIWKTNSGVR